MLLELRIRTILICCTMFLLRPALLVAEEPGNSQNQLVLKEGLNYFYNSDSESANRKFDEYIALEPDDPVGYWRKALSIFLRVRSEQKTDTPKFSENQRDELITLINQGIGGANTRIQRGDQSDFNLYVKACLYSIKAGVEFSNVSIWAARGSMRTAIGIAQRSQYQDAKYLIGLTNYRGADRNIIFGLAGLPHDRDKGLNLIFEAAIQNNGTFADDIWFAVFSIETDKRNERYYNRATVSRLFEYLFAKYPHNMILQRYLKENRK
ncbi:MAG: hypothetical protein HY434_02210 [Candidatus Liptonbacteria bacterium]|nr:hypothetical protein [Candidatus Liptonbacteria bacterium]